MREESESEKRQYSVCVRERERERERLLCDLEKNKKIARCRAFSALELEFATFEFYLKNIYLIGNRVC